MDIVQFDYENEIMRKECESAAYKIRARKRKVIEDVAFIGEQLTLVKKKLRHGQFGIWLSAYFEWSDDTAINYMRVHEAVSKHPELYEFWCVTGLYDYVRRPLISQAAVLEKKAYTNSVIYEQVVWDAAMREHLDDCGLDHSRRCGDVRYAIQEALRDDVLAPVAEKLYTEYRDTFARLEGVEPEVVDAELDVDTGPTPPPKDEKPMNGNKSGAQLVRGQAYLLFRWAGEGAPPVKELERMGFIFEGWSRSHVLLWPGPHLLTVFPENGNGADAASWGRAAEDAVTRRLDAQTLNGAYKNTL